MIVKNEAASIKSVLEKVKPFVNRYSILDTGSTDGTQDIIRETMSNIVGKVFEEPFVDFATTRNRILDLDWQVSSPAQYQLMLSGDEFLENGAALRTYLKTVPKGTDCFFIRLFLDGIAMATPRVFRTGSDWRYEGVIHEVPYNRVDTKASTALIPDVAINHIVSDHERRMSSIWENHIPLLQKELEKNPNDERTLIFLAQSYESLFEGFSPEEQIEYSREALMLYQRRLAIPTGIEDERNYVRMRALDTARHTGWFTDAQLLEEAQALCEADPHRPESALLRAEISKKVVPATKVYQFAAQAAEVAEKMNLAIATSGLDKSSPVSTSCCWMAHYLAAVCARQLAATHPEEKAREDYEALVRKHVTAGLEAGGNNLAFQPLTEGYTPPTT